MYLDGWWVRFVHVFLFFWRGWDGSIFLGEGFSGYVLFMLLVDRSRVRRVVVARLGPFLKSSRASSFPFLMFHQFPFPADKVKRPGIPLRNAEWLQAFS